MPSWCENVLTVTSDNQEELNTFTKAVKNPENGSALSLARLFPRPEELVNKTAEDNTDEYNLELIQKFGFTNLRDWSVLNWGTKWDVDSVQIQSREKHSIVYTFLSAWSPPCMWLISIAPKFPNIYFQLKFNEQSFDLQGSLAMQGEEVFWDECLTN